MTEEYLVRLWKERFHSNLYYFQPIPLQTLLSIFSLSERTILTRYRPSVSGPVTSSAGGLVKRAGAGVCDYTCPSPIPTAPTTGPLAITPGQIEPADAQKKHRRDIAGRVNVARPASITVTSINQCTLLTPSNPPYPVTTPDYLKGHSFWQLDKNNHLPASLQTISRYYRTTNIAGQCAPTLTSVPANALVPDTVYQNNKVTVDHAYENGWLKGFLQYVIESPNPATDQPQLPCAAANAIFFNTYPGSEGCAVNRLAPIYNALAGEDHPDFVMMSQFLNSRAKGWVSVSISWTCSWARSVVDQ